ncbi:carbamoyltransferase N-terminal domain-containing protein [Streptomyces sp. KHY 26]|uniref:carbamoyltransferase N-terminal domain-containing protein n=1 Tax=Streptomyces sp. KHY 26 TaxID=3097359 RepID=UPI00376EC8F3
MEESVKIVGLKLTHDGAVAMLDGGRLVFSVELEKIANNPRYSAIRDLGVISEVLDKFGYRIEDVDEWVLDGWNGRTFGMTEVIDGGKPQSLRLAPYRESDDDPDLLHAGHCGEFLIEGTAKAYSSYAHAGGHLASSYATSPFAAKGEPSIVLIWDGGMFPRVYYVDPTQGVTYGGDVFPLIGHAYAMSSHHFGPFKRTDAPRAEDDLSVAGKLMAYIALGESRQEIVDLLSETFFRHFEDESSENAVKFRQEVGGWGNTHEPSHAYVHAFYADIARKLEGRGFTEVDVLASVHQWLEETLVSRVADKVRSWLGDEPVNLTFAGGCALNIKWNSALREHPLFKAVWVPPFPNDSGSAIGAATERLWEKEGIQMIEWHARLGPDVVPSEVPSGWTQSPCSAQQLARLLHETGAPVVVLNDRAELGPRALGRRSILAPATDAAMKAKLNRMKRREDYRPVAPICLEDEAPAIFDPGTPDPYMLFDHYVRPDWVDRIPAVLHLDGTARLQTVSSDDDPTLEAILREYHRISGVPVLCNTSANFNGSGFFPDVASAAEWGQVDHIWSQGVLFSRDVSAGSQG